MPISLVAACVFWANFIVLDLPSRQFFWVRPLFLRTLILFSEFLLIIDDFLSSWAVSHLPKCVIEDLPEKMKIVIQIEGDSTDGQHQDVSSATNYHQQINCKFIIYFKKGQCVCIERSKVLKKYVQISFIYIFFKFRWPVKTGWAWGWRRTLRCKFSPKRNPLEKCNSKLTTPLHEIPVNVLLNSWRNLGFTVNSTSACSSGLSGWKPSWDNGRYLAFIDSHKIRPWFI